MLERFIEIFFGIGLFVNASLFIPQVIRIVKTGHARDASLITFAGFNIINFLTVLHGIIRHDVILTLGSGLALITNSCVTFAIIWYRYIQKTKNCKNAD